MSGAVCVSAPAWDAVAPGRPQPLPPAPDPPPVHVVAGVITDVRGRVLLARRTVGRDLAGSWEFPGGKVEPGESPAAALARELCEELGIQAEVGTPLIRVPQRMPHKRIVLDVHRVAAHRGRVRGLDGQALAWVPMEKLSGYPMPPADRPVVAALREPDRVLVTPSPDEDDAAWLAMLDTALLSGIRRVQLRAPACEPTRWRGLAGAAVEQCRRHGAEAWINADAGLALGLGVGLHLRARQLHDAALVRGLPPGLALAASCHSSADLARAEALGCRHAFLGAIRQTPSHPGQGGIGWTAFEVLREYCALPIYAIGGMACDDIPQARRHGAQGIAGIRGLWPG